ncbi:MAG: hypothetical protein KY393_03355, partial [Actinobacteria bacterium]|nr:hypothetical protein [Actinomycetota bacterium]
MTAEVRNTGGRALDLTGELTLTDGPGGLSGGPFPAELGTTLPVDGAAAVTVVLDEQLPDGTLNPLGANSFQRCTSAEDTTCVRDLSVTIAIKGSLLDVPNGPDDPPVEMRVGDSGSQTNALDCDPDVQKLEDEI